MSGEGEALAIALELQRWQGARAPVYIAEQLGALALRDDTAGIARWQEIAAAYDGLQRSSRQ